MKRLVLSGFILLISHESVAMTNIPIEHVKRVELRFKIKHRYELLNKDIEKASTFEDLKSIEKQIDQDKDQGLLDKATEDLLKQQVVNKGDSLLRLHHGAILDVDKDPILSNKIGVLDRIEIDLEKGLTLPYVNKYYGEGLKKFARDKSDQLRVKLKDSIGKVR
jgi:hypothetical protein